MKISTKGRYGLRAMMDLAMHSNENVPIYLSDIAKREEISEKYLEQIITTLKKSSLVKSKRGRRGGYLLARPANQIKLSDIIRALEGPLSVVECVSSAAVCHRSNFCVVRGVWITLSDKIEELLSSFTLSDLCRKQERKRAGTYHI